MNTSFSAVNEKIHDNSLKHTVDMKVNRKEESLLYIFQYFHIYIYIYIYIFVGK